MNDNELIQAIKEAFKETIIPLETRMDNMEIDIKDMRTDMTDMRGDMTDMKVRISNIENEAMETKYILTDVRRDLSKVESDTRKIKVTIENDIKKGIGLLLDGHNLDAENIKEIKETVEEIKETVLALDIMHMSK